MAVALTGIMPAAAADSPAGHLPTHLLIAPGDDAWSGRLRALQFAPTLGTLEAPLPPDLWEASRLLDYALVVDALADRLGPGILDADPHAILEGCELDITTLERVGEPYRTLRFYPVKEAS